MVRKKYISQNDLRRDNLKQYIRDVYKDSEKAFYCDFRKKLMGDLKYTEELSDTKIRQLKGALKKYKGRSFTKNLQDIVERTLKLSPNILAQVRRKRSPIYILISCTGESANLIFSSIKSNEIVDEVAILFGDVDIFMKVYATPEEVQKLITEDLFSIDNISISKTKTYFPLTGKSWMKHQVGKHPDYSPPSDRWY